ncbi:MAG: hypothetical protein LBR53_01185 [Deltaproteobacteria bacterium]|nr:hypothetical protein [Deltaproteobacteria bacterium]
MNTAPAGRRLFVILWLAVFLIYAAPPLSAQKSGPDTAPPPSLPENAAQLPATKKPSPEPAASDNLNPENLEQNLSLLKADFEKTLAPLKDPKIIQSLSLKKTDLALFMAVSILDPERYSGYYAEKEAILEKIWADKKMSWDVKEIYGLILYAESLSRLVVIISGKQNNQNVLKAFSALTAAAATGKAKSKPAKIAEARVYWSNRIVILNSLLLKLLIPESAQDLEDIMDDLLNKAEIIASRRDVHYQGRLDLLYLNNVEYLTRMQFLLAAGDRSPVTGDAEQMKGSWEKKISDPDLQVSEKTSVSLVTTAQLSFPLLYWICSVKFIEIPTVNQKRPS